MGSLYVPPAASAASMPVYGRRLSFDYAAAQLTQMEDLVFGTGATAGPGQTAIKNLSDLATKFTPFEDFTGLANINSEIQRYQEFNPINHAFTSDRLNLQAAIDTTNYSGGWPALVRQTAGAVSVPGTVSTTALGWPNTNGISVGQLVVFQYQGSLFVITGISGSNITFAQMPGAGSVNVNNNLNVCLPMFGAQISGNTNGDTIPFGNSLSPGIKVGMAISYYDGGGIRRSADHRVIAINGGNVSVAPNIGSFGPGGWFIFMPPVTSGQIWSKAQYDLTRSDAIWGFDATMVLATDSSGGAFNSRGVNQLAQLNAAPPDYAWGHWPAFWVYQANDGRANEGDNSEIDFLEIWYHTTGGVYSYLGADHSPLNINYLYRKTSTDNWGDGGYNLMFTPFSMANEHRISCLVTPRGTLRFIDNYCVQETDYRWTATRPAQIGFDNVPGSLANYLIGSLSFPFSAAGFPNSKFGIKRMRTFVSRPV